MVRRLTPKENFEVSVGLLIAANLFLYLFSAFTGHTFAYSYLVWNLFLAWLPLLIAYRLVLMLKIKRWSSWEGIGLSLLWLVFLPNSFYMITDFIHLPSISASNSVLLYDSISFVGLIFTALVLGYISLYIVHVELKKRRGAIANYLIALTVLFCSLGIYIGRDLRWSSWDVITNPGGLIYDLNSHIIHISTYPQIIAVTGLFFILISSFYIVAWNSMKYIKMPKANT